MAIHALRHQAIPFLLQACDVWAPSFLLKKELHFLLVLRELGRSMYPVKCRDGAQHLDPLWNGIVGFVLVFECFVYSAAVLGGPMAEVGS